jgi:hypothetical protein
VVFPKPFSLSCARGPRSQTWDEKCATKVSTQVPDHVPRTHARTRARHTFRLPTYHYQHESTDRKLEGRSPSARTAVVPCTPGIHKANVATATDVTNSMLGKEFGVFHSLRNKPTYHAPGPPASRPL